MDTTSPYGSERSLLLKDPRRPRAGQPPTRNSSILPVFTKTATNVARNTLVIVVFSRGQAARTCSGQVLTCNLVFRELGERRRFPRSAVSHRCPNRRSLDPTDFQLPWRRSRDRSRPAYPSMEDRNGREKKAASMKTIDNDKTVQACECHFQFTTFARMPEKKGTGTFCRGQATR